MQSKTQTEDVLKHLILYGSITSLEAIREYGATRLSAIIYRLKHVYHYEIITETVKVKNRYGRPVEVARYRLMSKI